MTTVKQLRHFLTLAKELHFARAAAELGISQAALSNEIKKMEKSLGFQLFDRSDRWEITMTEAGKNYWYAVKEIPGMIDSAKSNSVKIARGLAGNLSIGISYLNYDYFNLGEICRRMQLHYPEVNLKIYDMQRTPDVAESLRQGRIDVGFLMISREQDHSFNGFYIKKLLPIELMLCVSAKHPLAKKEELTAEDLKNAHFILPPRENLPKVYNTLANFLYDRFQTLPQVRLEVMGFKGISQMISNGLGIGFLPQLMIEKENLIVKKSPFRLLRELCAACDENNQSKIVRNFINLLPDEQNCN